MKKFLIIIVLAIARPLTVLAQQWDESISNDGFVYASIFAGNFSLLLSVVIGIIATGLVFRAAKKLGGGLFGSVLNYIAIGMLFVVLGTVATIVDPWFMGFGLNIVSTTCFAMGYIFMVLGASKLFKGIMNN